MNNTLLDNSESRKMADALRQCIANPDYKEIMIATGFWDLPGTKLVARQLEDFLDREGTTMRLLIGSDPVVRSRYLDKTFPDDAIKEDIFALHFSEDYQPLISLLFRHCKADPESSKIKIRIYKRDPEGNARFLHSKCYIFANLETEQAVGIIGSSNFTQKGLEGNAELNYLETDPRTVLWDSPGSRILGHRMWFNQMWEQSEDWNGTFVNDILAQAPVAQANPDNPENQTFPQVTPHELYIRYLQTQFGDMLDADTTALLRSYLPDHYSRFDYQLDAVKQGFSIMKRYRGFILGDVVGLGKTVVGLMLARHFLENAADLGRPRRVLIVTPPSIKQAWLDTIADFDRDKTDKMEPLIKFVTTGSIGHMVEDFDADLADYGDTFGEGIGNEPCGLILVDESHNFRNRGTQKYDALDALIGRTNPQPFVCLLSATPQNNSPRDLYNQICLFQRDTNNTDLQGVPGGKLDTFFNEAEQRFRQARNMPQDTPESQQQAREIIAKVSADIRNHVLNELVVRRTRTDIKNHYRQDLHSLNFPTVRGPHKLEYKMDEEMQQLFFDTISAICPDDPDDTSTEHIKFHRYAAISYFADQENARRYERRNLTVAGITARLQKMMQTTLVKRLESSQAAFKSSLTNLLRYTRVMLDMLDHDRVYICPDIEVNKVHEESEGKFDVFREAMDRKMAAKGGNNMAYRASDFTPDYKQRLSDDSRIIDKLLQRWNASTYDPKFERFKEAVAHELFDKDINNPSGHDRPRLVIFTEAIDTLHALTRWLKSRGYRVLGITAANRKELQPVIAENFDANLSPELQRDDYNVIVTTEVLAEGVNLHRANVILNYDAPWNATRLMQRIGRINRLGSKEAEVHVFNFFPSVEGNEQIRLIEKAYAKLQSFHEMFGEDNKVFSEREQIPERELQQMADGAESPQAPFIAELKEYQTAHPERYAWLKSLPLDMLGGSQTRTDEWESALVIFRDQTSGLTSVSLSNQPDNAPRVISPLDTMRRLKCDPDARFLPGELSEDSPLLLQAKNAYLTHVDHVLSRSDSNSRITEAQQFIGTLRNLPQISHESRRMLRTLQTLVRNRNNFVISTLLRQKRLADQGQLSLFGHDFEINSWLQASFAHISQQASTRRGEATTAIYEIR